LGTVLLGSTELVAAEVVALSLFPDDLAVAGKSSFDTGLPDELYQRYFLTERRATAYR
jgi:hypothetical protein